MALHDSCHSKGEPIFNFEGCGLNIHVSIHPGRKRPNSGRWKAEKFAYYVRGSEDQQESAFCHVMPGIECLEEDRREDRRRYGDRRTSQSFD